MPSSGICFVCQLPVLSHQIWSIWKNNLLAAPSAATSPSSFPSTSSAGNYVNNTYHEDCLACAICSTRVKTNNGTAKRYGNKVYCALHYADVSGIGSGGEEFMAKLRDFKRQSLGCAEARRKSSTTLSFSVPVQACPGLPNCGGFPHDIKPTSGYWIECKGGGEWVDRDHREKPTEANLGPSSLSLHRSNTSSEGLFLRPRLERQDTSKSTNDMEPMCTLQPPTIQIIDSSHLTKDDIELYRRHPNIVITMPASSPSPPSPRSPVNKNAPQSPKGSPCEEPFELICFQEEMFEKHYYGKEHWNYFTNDEALGPIILSLKQETLMGRDQFRLLFRTVSYALHGLVPTSSICADRYDREAVVRSLGDEAGLKPNLVLGQLASTPDELIKLDQVFIKSELKVGVVHIKEGQTSEESILGNKTESPLFLEFLSVLGERVRLRGFDKYKGGLDTVHDLTGTESIYTSCKGIEIMFHVSTMLPHEDNDPQKLQKKRHIGNDIVCVAFIEGDETPFWPGCIKSHFLHTFIVVKTTPVPLEPGEMRKYSVSVACRDEVTAFKPYLWHQSTFEKGPHFREWLLTKIINGERASYSAPKFARMQDRTRSQMLEDIVTNLANHLVTGQIPKPYRRGSWRPIGHMRPSSPLLDSVRDLFEGYDQLAKDFTTSFHGNPKLICDVAFNVIGNPNNGPNNPAVEREVRRIYGVRAILAIRSRVFLEMLYGFSPPGSSTANQAAIAAATAPVPTTTSKSSNPKIGKSGKRGSITAETMHKIAQIPKIITNQGSDGKVKRKNSLFSAPKMSKVKTPTYLTVPGAPITASGSSGGSGGSGKGGEGSGGGIRAAFTRLVSGGWAGWGSKNRTETMKRWQSESIYAKLEGNQEMGVELPGLSVCADVAKIDRNKLAQNEFNIIEFDGDTFQTLIEYLHSGSCPLTCVTVPGLICAAEHFDLPDLLQACFYHTKTHMKLSVVPNMLSQLENYYWRYNSASQLVNTLFKFVDSRANKLFARHEYLSLSESMLTSLLARQTLSINEIKRFQVMLSWATHKVMTTSSGNKGGFGELDGSLPHPANMLQIPQSYVQPVTGREAAAASINNSSLHLQDSERQRMLTPSKVFEVQVIMNRLTRDLKLHKIPPQELITIVLPTKTISHQRILATLLYQADTGIYRNSEYPNFGS